MAELKERFSLADDLAAPDLWAEARGRAVDGERSPAIAAGAERSEGWRRLLTAAVAFAVFVAAALFAWEAFHADVRPRPGPVLQPPPVDLAEELGRGWSELPAPPEVRSSAATAWTGSQLIAWGGYVFGGGGDKVPMPDGFVFDAGSSTWSDLPVGPLAARARPASAWTGSELLVWGGWDGGTGFLGDGAAYDPVAESWRPLPPAPIDARAPLSVWTGEEMIVWGTAIRFPSAPMDGAAYDPVANTWRRIPESPIRLTDATAVWTGDEMIVFGAALDGNNHAETETDIGAAYDPVTDSWRRIPDSTLSPQAATAAWPGTGELIAWDYEQATAAYDPQTDSWRDLTRVPLRFYECYPQSVAIAGSVFGEFCSQLALFSTAEDRWREITRDELSGWVVEPIAAGSAFLVMAHSLEVSNEGDQVFATRMLAYVPDQPVTDGEHPAPFVPATEIVGGEGRMPITFPDGSSAALVFPTELNLAGLGVQPDVSYIWRDDPPPRFPIVFLPVRNASIDEYVEGTAPVGSVNSSRGIEIWRMSDAWAERRLLLSGHWLRYELPSWTVLVALDGRQQADEVAAGLDLRQTPAGFPVADASGPIALAEGFGEAEGPQLGVGDRTSDPATVSQLDATIFLSPDGCSPSSVSQPTEGYGSSCLANGHVFASIYGDRQFVSAVVEGLRVENFHPA